ncbi:MAG: outer membrane protein assembly factor BamE [Azoarcus sp.]|jgi:uncharacterized membrane protein YgcG|nr:outer membrane protein assembly factor BamE [Azoarcus sp.]
MKEPVTRLFRGLALAAAFVLGGCASTPPLPAYTTEAEVLAERGEPSARWYDYDSSTTTLEYSTQPDGVTCLMLRVDDEGKVLRQWDALDARNLSRVKPGMSQESVRQLLGEHRSERVYPGTREEVWDWNIRHRGRGKATLFNVHFLDGRVRYTDRTRLSQDGEREWADDLGWNPWYPLYPFGAFWLWLNIGSGHHWGHGGHWHSGGHWRGGGRGGSGGRGGGGHFRGH